LYEAGRGVPQDYAEAMRWYRKAADAGNSWGMYNIGALHGWGVRQDYAEAMKWFRQAADAGDSDGDV
jgi:TPR repeat protein